MSELEFFSQSTDIISVNKLLINLVTGFVLSLLLRWHFSIFGSSFSNRDNLGSIFIYIALTVTLIISIVKSSLALSLGLVGALSIIRFRTPIKEPEELAYLFIAISIGIGLGAGQTIATIAAIITILVITTIVKLIGNKKEQKNLFLSVNFTENSEEESLNKLTDYILFQVKECEIRRIDYSDNKIHATYFISANKAQDIFSLIEKLKQEFKDIEISFIDQHRIPSV